MRHYYEDILPADRFPKRDLDYFEDAAFFKEIRRRRVLSETAALERQKRDAALLMGSAATLLAGSTQDPAFISLHEPQQAAVLTFSQDFLARGLNPAAEDDAHGYLSELYLIEGTKVASPMQTNVETIEGVKNGASN